MPSKAKRKLQFSPLTINTSLSSASGYPALKSPRNKRRKGDKTVKSPKRRRSVNEVRPPPEFLPFDYRSNCPEFTRLLECGDADDAEFDGNALTNLQHELEAMLVHAADYKRRAYGEVTYLQTGEYPVQDLRNRPMPRFKMRQQPSVAQMSPAPNPNNPMLHTPTGQHSGTGAGDGPAICGLPIECGYPEDNDAWPPPNVIHRFWNWHKLDILHAIEPGLLRSFKSLLLDRVAQDEYRPLYENAPWKYRSTTPAPASSRLRSGSIHQSPSTSRHQPQQRLTGLGEQSIRPFRIDDPVNMFAELPDGAIQSTSRESPGKLSTKRESKEEDDDGASSSHADQSEFFEDDVKETTRVSPIRSARVSRSNMASGTRAASPIKDRDKAQQQFVVPTGVAARRQSGRLASRDSRDFEDKDEHPVNPGVINGTRRLSITIKSEPLDITELDEPDYDEVSSYLRSGRTIVSPRIKKELRDEEWQEDNKCNYINGHAYGGVTNGVTTNGTKKNGDLRINGQLKLNGINGLGGYAACIIENGHSKKKKAPRSLNKLLEEEYENSEGVDDDIIAVEPKKLSRRMSNGIDKLEERDDELKRQWSEETEELNPAELLERMDNLMIGSEESVKQDVLMQFGAKVTRHLIGAGIIPEDAAEEYEQLIIRNFYDEIVNEEGRENADSQEMDELSCELLKYQCELRDTESQLRGLTHAVWKKLREDFATCTTSEQLDDASYDLFRLAVNMYREAPNRRLPQASEQPILLAAVEKRKQKAKAYYGNRYVDQPPFHQFSPARLPDKDSMMCPKANPQRMVPKWMRRQVPSTSMQKIVNRKEWTPDPISE